MDQVALKLQDWLAALDEAGKLSSPLNYISHGENWSLYIAASGPTHYAVKRFTDSPGSPTGGPTRASDRAAAEAEGLRIFEPRGLAPQLVWHGDLPAEIGGCAVVYRWVEGNTVGQRPLAPWEVDLYMEGLRAVHSEDIELRIISPRPRNLEAWWSQTHEVYRELPAELLDEIPAALREDLAGLVQAVAADVHTHKRYWQGASLTPVHGYALTHNLIMKGRKPVLVDWQRFGLGDPSFEVSYVSGMMARFAGGEASDRLVTRYLESAQDTTLAPRIEIYRRVWPLSRVLYLITSAWGLASGHGRVGTPRTALLYWGTALQFQLRRCLETYGRQAAGVENTLSLTGQWMEGLERRAEAES